MGCCVPYQFPFSNVAFSAIDYNDVMKASLGPYPKIQVFYFDPETGDYYELNGNPGTETKFDGNTISIDHGGLQSGIVKVS